LDTGVQITFESDVATVSTPPTNTTDVVLTVGNEVKVITPNSVGEIPTDYPVTIDAATVTPAAVPLGEGVTLVTSVTAPVNESSTIANIVYSIDGGSFLPVPPTDGLYDSVSESGTLSLGSFSVAGIHEVCVRGVDTFGSPSQEECVLLAVYDAEGGYVTGGGQIESPSGAYAEDAGLTGKAHFAFIAEYEYGAQIPTGNTQFRFNGAGLRFKSTSYEWLVVAGARAQYKGYGDIGKESGYRFMLTAVDGDALGNNGQPDKFRMKIWNDATGGIVYDNQMSDGDAANVSTAITHGSIVIHNE
jgi:hypothetical protein